MDMPLPPAMWVCPECGKKNKPIAEVCAECGAEKPPVDPNDNPWAEFMK